MLAAAPTTFDEPRVLAVLCGVAFVLVLWEQAKRGRHRSRRFLGRRRARRQTNQEPRAFSEAQKLEMFLRDEGLCQYCGVVVHFATSCQWVGCCEDSFEADHDIPWSRGGRTDLSNGVTSCRADNRSKGDMTGDEYRAAKHLPRRRRGADRGGPRRVRTATRSCGRRGTLRAGWSRLARGRV